MRYLGIWQKVRFWERLKLAWSVVAHDHPAAFVSFEIEGDVEFKNLTINGPVVFGITSSEPWDVENITWRGKPPLWVESEDGKHWKVKA